MASDPKHPYVIGLHAISDMKCHHPFDFLTSLFLVVSERPYGRIVLPLSQPILAAIAITTTLGACNDYIWPLVTITYNTIQTCSVGVTKFASEYNLDYSPTLDGYALGSLPSCSSSPSACAPLSRASPPERKRQIAPTFRRSDGRWHKAV